MRELARKGERREGGQEEDRERGNKERSVGRKEGREQERKGREGGRELVVLPSQACPLLFRV